MSQVGRIGGHLLNPNLERRGVDLAFKNTAFNDPVLYLQVDPQLNTVINATDLQADILYKIRTVGTSNFILIGATSNTPGTIFRAIGPTTGTGDAYALDDDNDPNPTSGSGTRIGINTDTPVYDLDVISDARTTNLTIGNVGYIDNITISNTDTFSTVSGPINILPNQSNPLITFDKLASDNLVLNDNTIGSFSNSNVTLDTNGTGKLKIFSSTDITGNLYATGNITLDGNLSAAENIIVGDTPFDTVTVGTDFTQTLEPATDNTFDIGSADKRWANFWSDDWQTPDNLTITGMIISDQVRIDGTQTGGEIFSLQSNDNLNLLPNNGYTFGEYIRTFNASDETAKNRYGHAVAVNSSYMATSAWAASPNTVYVYNAVTGETVYTILNPTSDDTDLFGYAIDMNDDYLAITATNADVNTGDAAGKVYVYELATGTLQYTISNPDPSVAIPRDFGYSVGVSDSYLIVGAPASNLASSTSDTHHTGEVRIYNISNGSLVRTLADPGSSRPHPSGTYVNSWFGRAVDVAETYAIVGAPGMEYGSRERSGEIHVYNISTGVRTRNIDNPFFNSTYYEDGEWGFAVATTDTYFAAGGPEQDFGGQVYLYRHSGGTVFSVRNTDLGYSIDLTDDYMVVGNGSGFGQARIYDTAGNLLFEFEDDYTDFDSGPASSSFENGRDVAISDNLIAISIAGNFVSILEQGRIIVINAADTATYVEDLEFKESNITNLLNTPIAFTSTGIGYLRFMGDNGFVIPAGGDDETPVIPEEGDTRWNTDQERLECFDAVTGTYITSIGPGEVVTQDFVEELGNIYSLILG